MDIQAIRKEIGDNPKQLEAVETIDGPVLVVAGPGTGKTQILSLRVANILDSRDISPENILCLTFTDAGSQAMQARLARFIGKEAYGVRINTFHAFASYLQSRFPEYFPRSPFDTLITGLQSGKLLDQLLRGLSVADPLYVRAGDDGMRRHCGNVRQFIGKVKKSGLTSDQLRAIVRQSLDTIEYLQDKTDLAQDMCSCIPGKAVEKAEFCDDLKVKASLIFQGLPSDLKEKLVALPGSYEPFGAYLSHIFDETEWYEGENNATKGFRKLRDAFFDSKSGTFRPSLINCYKKMLSALDVFDKYQAHLIENELYDFDDMILDTVAAIEGSEEFKSLLQNQYQYILVDEFQDTNGSQMRIIELLTEGIDSPNIMAVGDDDQAIMRFQGASVAFLKQFEESYKGTKRIVLNTNYRSTPSLVGLGQAVAKQIEGRSEASEKDKKLTAAREEKSPTQFVVKKYDTPDLQYFDIARDIKRRIDEGFVRNASSPQEAIAVLAWKRSSLTGLIPYLKMFGIDYTYDVLETVGKSESVQSLLACIRYVSHLAEGDEGRADPWLAQVLAAPELGIPAEEFVPFAIQANKARYDGGWSTALLKCTSPELRKISRWLSEAAKIAAGYSARQALHFLAKPFVEYYQGKAGNDPYATAEFNYGLAALLDFVESERQAEGATHSLRLADVSRLLGEAEKFGVEINISVPVSRPEAVALKTAHKSKGLEYDLVYLLDADQATWTSNGGAGGISCPNIYLNESADADDMRRLLFVAITRARFELQMSLGRPGIVAELIGNAEENEVTLSLEEIGSQSASIWTDSYYPEDHTIKDLVHAALSGKSLSVSTLNNFVRYDPDAPHDGKDFIMSKAFNFPRGPIAYFEFGTLMHKYLELFLNRVIKAKDMTPDELLAHMHENIDALDFDPSEIASLHERLDLVAQVFVPVANEYLDENSLAEQWIKATVDEVPLIGQSDLLAFDEETKTIRICDWKTGKPKKIDDGYRRQLVFYKILVEESGMFPGWTVAGSMDIFIEPDAKTRELQPPVIENVPIEDVEHVRKLAKAVYHRIQNADFDTSGFDPSGIDPGDLQRAYELWLIEASETSD